MAPVIMISLLMVYGHEARRASLQWSIALIIYKHEEWRRLDLRLLSEGNGVPTIGSFEKSVRLDGRSKTNLLSFIVCIIFKRYFASLFSKCKKYISLTFNFFPVTLAHFHHPIYILLTTFNKNLYLIYIWVCGTRYTL